MTTDPPNLLPFSSDGDRDEGALPDVPRDADVSRVLRGWSAPQASEALDARVLETFRARKERGSSWRRRLTRWARRGAMLAASVTVLVAGLWVLANRQPLVAAQLLEKSRQSDALLLGNPQVAVHRVLTYEERRVSDGQVVRRRRVESWRRGGSAVTARRAFDDGNQLVAGEWIGADGSRQVRGDTPASNAWSLMEPSAESFSALLQTSAVSELTGSRLGSDRLAIAYHPRTTSGSIESANLVLRASDFHGLSQTVRTRVDGESRDFSVSEVALEPLSVAALAPGLFEPDSVVADMTPPATPKPPIAAPRRVSATTLLDIEVDLLQRLDRVGALLGREASVIRTPDRRIDVRAVVESDARKRELLNALDDPHRAAIIELDVRTIADATSRRAASRAPSPAVRDVGVSGTMALYDDLRRHFGDDKDVLQFANEMLARSNQALLHAGAVRDLIARFTPTDLSTMTDLARDQWRGLVTEHANGVQRETALLRLSLQPVLFPSRVVDAVVHTSPVTATEMAEHLFAQVLAHDEAVRAGFAVSSRAASDLDVKRDGFLWSLHAAEDLAMEIARQ